VQNTASEEFWLVSPGYSRPGIDVSRLDMRNQRRDKVVEVAKMRSLGICEFLIFKSPGRPVLNSVGGFAGHCALRI